MDNEKKIKEQAAPYNKPFLLFDEWFKDATQEELNDPNAMALATIDKENIPNIRMVLLKGFDETGFVFYTNLESQKGQEILEHPYVALCFHWKSLKRQVRIRGKAKAVSEEEANAYFSSRPHKSKIGAWASKQSKPLEDRFALEKAVAHYTAHFALTSIPRPPHWSGFRVVPLSFEFWQDRAFRLHERLFFYKQDDQKDYWQERHLYP